VSDEPSPTTGGGASKAAFGSLFFFCLGALLGRLAPGLFPPLLASMFDWAIYAGIAFSVALAYRRFVRRTIETRRRDRARRERPDASTT